ncbi:EF-hand calcium-binding domain-containing protein 11 [Trichoplax sp. H2]|nr:EF-hand calcium-binding domain-containing protein 11 [Trichoplax sp. H2]|eukprot:RDD38559.1 EF-hand calcium-binding domain-containing protein 11 [Trichoplax sp. H2]
MTAVREIDQEDQLNELHSDKRRIKDLTYRYDIPLRINESLMQIISQCDADKKGYLSIDDLQVAMVAILGYKSNKGELEKLLSPEFNFNGISLSACEDLLITKLQEYNINEKIKDIFMSFDAHCRGFLTLSDLMSVFDEVAPRISKATVTSIFRNIDFDEDGRVSYRDFEYMMRLHFDSLQKN